MSALNLHPDADQAQTAEPVAPALPVEQYVIGLTLALKDAEARLATATAILRFNCQDRATIARELNALQSAVSVGIENFNTWAQVRDCKGSA